MEKKNIVVFGKINNYWNLISKHVSIADWQIRSQFLCSRRCKKCIDCRHFGILLLNSCTMTYSFIHKYVCMFVYMYAYIYICMHRSRPTRDVGRSTKPLCNKVYIYICVCIYLTYVCIMIFIYVYIIYIYIQWNVHWFNNMSFFPCKQETRQHTRSVETFDWKEVYRMAT